MSERPASGGLSSFVPFRFHVLKTSFRYWAGAAATLPSRTACSAGQQDVGGLPVAGRPPRPSQRTQGVDDRAVGDPQGHADPGAVPSRPSPLSGSWWRRCRRRRRSGRRAWRRGRRWDYEISSSADRGRSASPSSRGAPLSSPTPGRRARRPGLFGGRRRRRG